jgi:glycogen(starch) synthase
MARLLVVTNMYPPHHYGGYELVCREAVEDLRRRGHDVTVLTSDLRVEDRVDDDQDVRRTLRLYWREPVVVSPPLRERLAIERANQRALRAALDDVRPDVVSVWAMGALSMGMLATVHRRPVAVVHVVNDDWLVYGPEVDAWHRLVRRAGPLAGALERISGVPCRLPDLGSRGTYLFVSEATRRAAQEHSRWRFADTAVVYGGVNTADFDPTAWTGRSGWGWRLLAVSRLDPRKGLDTAVRAVAQLPPEATLDILGSGDASHRAELEQLARELDVDDRVRFGVTGRDEMAARYAGADAFVFTSRWSEPFGLTPLEAMACATPVVATAVGGTAEFLVDGANALCVPPDDPAALAAAVRRLAADPALRARLVEGGRATVEELGVRRWLDDIAAWHEAAAAGFAGGRPPPRRPVGEVLAERLA